jgi:hypothetical protein
MSPPGSSKRNATFLIALLAILAALPAGYFLFLHQPEAPPPPVAVAPAQDPAPTPEPAPAPEAPEAPPEPKLAELKIETIQGTVEVRHHHEADAAWKPAQPDEALHPKDSVRTADGSYAVLIGGKAVRVKMEPGTEISVKELTDKLSRMNLENGMTTTTVTKGSGHTIEIHAEGSDVVAHSEDGTSFTMSNDGKGTVGVGTREGEVALTGKGHVVIVRAGQQSIVRPGQAPSDPAPVPTSLLLKVNWPAKANTLKKRQVLVTGNTEPGARVEVAGKTITPDADGHFSYTVLLQEGRNPVSVNAVSVGGLRQEETRDLKVNTRGPRLKVREDLWEERK